MKVDRENGEHVLEFVVRICVEPKTATREQEKTAVSLALGHAIADLRYGKFGVPDERGACYVGDVEIVSVKEID